MIHQDTTLATDPMPSTNPLPSVDIGGIFRNPIVATVLTALIVIGAIAVVSYILWKARPIFASWSRRLNAATTTDPGHRRTLAMAETIRRTWPGIAADTTGLKKTETRSSSAASAAAFEVFKTAFDMIASMFVKRRSERATYASPRPARRRRTATVDILSISADDTGVTATLDTGDFPRAGTVLKSQFLDSLAQQWNAYSVTAHPGIGGTTLLRVLPTPPRTRAPRDIIVDPRAVPLGEDLFNTPITHDLSEKPTIAIQGRNATRLVQEFIATLAPRPDTQFFVVDGKTPDPQRSTYAALADRLLALGGDTGDVTLNKNPISLTELLTTLVEYRRAVAAQPTAPDFANFWAHGPSIETPLLVLVIDGFHAFFGDDVDRATQRRRTAALVDLLTYGGEFGIVTLITHVDDLPPKIRRRLIAASIDLAPTPKAGRTLPAASATLATNATVATFHTYYRPEGEPAAVATATRDHTNPSHTLPTSTSH